MLLVDEFEGRFYVKHKNRHHDDWFYIFSYAKRESAEKMIAQFKQEWRNPRTKFGHPTQRRQDLRDLFCCRAYCRPCPVETH